MKFATDINNLEQLAASQWGMFTTSQAQKHGIQRNQIARLAKKNKAEPLSYGVYRMTAGEETAAADIKAAWMSVYPQFFVAERMKRRPYDAVVAGRTAAVLHNLGDFYASPYTFIVPTRKQSSRGEIKYLPWVLDNKDVVFADGLPTTSLERTIADLVHLREEPSYVDGVISEAAQKELKIDSGRLAELLAPLASRNGYKKNDGGAFSRDLLARNYAEIQLERAGNRFSQALDLVEGQEPIEVVYEFIRIPALEGGSESMHEG